MSEGFRSFSARIVELTSLSDLSWVVFRSVGSTNTVAAQAARKSRSAGEIFSATALIAWAQRDGRGRGAKRWESRAGEGVWASILMPRISPEQLSLLPLATGIALADEVQKILPSEVRLKWPNDLYVGSAKIGGILSEAMSRGDESSAVVGFGINHGASPPRLNGRRATSIIIEAGHAPPLADFAVNLVTAVHQEISCPRPAAELLARVRELSVHRIGDTIEVKTMNGAVSGAFQRIDERGLLVLETAGGVQRVSSGELLQP